MSSRICLLVLIVYILIGDNACTGSEGHVLWTKAGSRPWRTVEAYSSKSECEKAGRERVSAEFEATSTGIVRKSADGLSFALWMRETDPGDGTVPLGAVWFTAKCWPNGVNPR